MNASLPTDAHATVVAVWLSRASVAVVSVCAALSIGCPATTKPIPGSKDGGDGGLADGSTVDASDDGLQDASSDGADASESCEGALCTEEQPCENDLDCEEDRYCNGTICVDDGCLPGTRACDDVTVTKCSSNGGQMESLYACTGSTAFESACEQDDGHAYCTCEDDWDCPVETTCEIDRCEGTGLPSTCRLAPEPFTEVLPRNEISWGGTGWGHESSDGSPFPLSAQVVMQPVVANLDDDNGDGLVNELDFPEIVFLTFRDSVFRTRGILRAIHGGGPAKGTDYFAACAATTWHEGEDANVACPCPTGGTDCYGGDLQPTASIAVGDLDDDGLPEIVAVTDTDDVRVFDNRGNIRATYVRADGEASLGRASPAPAIANVDHEGFAEIIVGRSVFTLGTDAEGDLEFLDRFEGTESYGQQWIAPMSCVADILGDELLEIVAGPTVYRFPEAPAGLLRPQDCTGSETGTDATAFCASHLVTAWYGPAVNGTTDTPEERTEGYCAIADVLGASTDAPPGPDNPLDGTPEVVLVASGRLQIYVADSGLLAYDVAVDTGSDGGAPNIDDFDGDGFPEIGTAFGTAYGVFDLQASGPDCPEWTNVLVDGIDGLQGNTERVPPPGTCASAADCGDTSQFGCNVTASECVCLQNGWRRQTEDDSSRVTGSSVFDFNGDGVAEVIYNDECYFRVYDGLDGTVYFKEHSPSRTRTEYPVIADVDNDGNAEIVFATSNESLFCGAGRTAALNDFNNGLEVWGDAADLWVSARRIWNQHTYHVTNVFESGGIPLFEAGNWETPSGRAYNTYRSNPRSHGVAPDLRVAAAQVSSPDAACGVLTSHLLITAIVENAGDLRVGPGVVVAFYGVWETEGLALDEALHADGAGVPLTVTLSTSLEPSDSTRVTASYNAANNSPGVLPDAIRIVVDDLEAERECIETNNELELSVDAGDAVADLTVTIDAIEGSCAAPEVVTTVTNDGALPASGIVVRYYAGDPSTAATAIHEERVDTELAAGGASTTFVATLEEFPRRNIRIYVRVDPDDAIDECNDGNNEAMADEVLACGIS